MKKKTIDGNEACSNTSYMFTEVAGIYPITPSSPMAENIDKWSNNGRKNLFNDQVKVVEMQSEAGAAGMVHGSLKAGSLTSTYTASQGLLLMIPNIYKASGEMLPLVIHVAARSIATHALSILGDHQDIYATRMTGTALLASSSVQDTAHLSAVAHLSAIKASLPFLHFFDGFRTSHELQKIDVLEENELLPLIDQDALNEFRGRALNPLKPKTYGTNQNDDIYFQATEVRNKYYDNLPDIVNEYMEKINKLAETSYKPFNYYGDLKATKVIVAMGSVCETIKETIDELDNVGLIEVHLYRPFSIKYLLEVLPVTVKKIAVLDRTKEPGSIGEPLYLDICSSLKDKDIEIVGGRYGLSSKDTTPAQIKAVYDMLDKPRHNFTIGIIDDETKLSLEIPDFKIKNSSEILIYGYGSDGMVSSSKSIIKIVSENTSKYVQGYFQYDSKKSGGVTKCHLRFNDKPIRSTYYVQNPRIIAVTKDTYMDNFKILDDIEENGIFILNTIKTSDEITEYLNDSVKKIIVDKNIKFYIINAYELARKVGLGNKISTIMEAVIMRVTDLVPFNKVINDMKSDIEKRFKISKPDMIDPNLQAIDLSQEYLTEVKIAGSYSNIKKEYKDVYEAMRNRVGDELPVSAFVNMPDGGFESGTSKLEKRMISDLVPKWLKENCINCNQCAFVCPHSVIRPYQLSDEEYANAPDIVKKRCDENKYIIGVSVKDCTGCGLCIKTCPGKKTVKALISEKLVDNLQEQEIFDYLEKNITCKEEAFTNIKNSQFKEPKIEFNGACAGCGQPAYIKLLTQMLGDKMIIANATGCSSIYGGSAPSMPYTIPWANSLFEDNAEYGYGMLVANQVLRNRVKNYMESNKDSLFEKWLNNCDNYEIAKEVYKKLDYSKHPELEKIKDYILPRDIWIIGGDGWAYDIGFGGIDHILSTNDKVRILVLDTEVYSNTGGQSSKSTPKGSIALFASGGKETAKKDLARMMMSYPHVYVAQINIGANPMHVIKTFNEVNNYDGPAIIIAYAPCIAHGIQGGMINSLDIGKEATACGYFPLFRYNPVESKFSLDSKADFNLYKEFLLKQKRYNVLDKIKENADEILEFNKQNAINRYAEYEKMSNN